MFLGYDYIILRAKQVHCLESLYLKWDLLAIKLPKGYGKSLVFQVLPYLLNERDARKALSSQEGPSVVLVVSPLNSLMYDQINELKQKGVKASVLGVTEGVDEKGDSVVASKLLQGSRTEIIKAGCEIVFCHSEALLFCKDGLWNSSEHNVPVSCWSCRCGWSTLHPWMVRKVLCFHSQSNCL